MAAGFIAKSLSTLLSSVSRWVEFSDASTAPVHGAIQLDPATGLPLDVSAPTLVQVVDQKQFSATVSGLTPGAQTRPVGVLLSVDTTGYDGAKLWILANAGGNTIVTNQSPDGENWAAIYGQSDAFGFTTLPTNQTTSSSVTALSYADLSKFFEVRISNYVSGSVTVMLELTKGGTSKFIQAASQPIPQTNTARTPTPARIQSSANANPTVVKSSSGVLNHGFISNNGAELAYFKLYNKATAPVIADTPVATIALPANGLPVPLMLPSGFPFTTGIAYRIVGGAADSDNTSVSADQVTGFLGYS
ncbi:hypothetical protein [Caulobacter phage Cr30]|uniref:hypothetical protein n=1 Tax=Caulobacter phage Cr30 TaxID=1357714 RepID=UPI0004A9B6D6|nr:hypothetical protein OZ74_gp071 [Caulobacter phage Cr30]AGS80956.1 hypothetical protein [Caulobacter phage Cr30]